MRSELLQEAGRIHERFKGAGLTLAVAESCTGGLVSHLLTELPGASLFFIAGLVTYAPEAKRDLLGIPPAVIERHGVVSDEVCRLMAERVRAAAKVDFGLATTGNLGPDALEGKECGLVYVAVCGAGATLSRELHVQGDRSQNKEAAALAALRLLGEAAGSEAKTK